MPTTKPIHTALISVFHKDGLKPLVESLAAKQVTIYSTGGTQKFIEDLGIEVIPVEALTSYPSILGGRVKTLHPKIFGGILARRDNEQDVEQLQEFQIPELDLIVVDLYPFEETVAAGGSEQEIIEKIDIGGISLIRAAAKNFKDTAIISNMGQYASFIETYNANNGGTKLEDRKQLAKEAFDVSSHYDSQINLWFRGDNPLDGGLKLSEQNVKTLRYGENPHQGGQYFGDLDAIFTQHNGKELSYNNLLDVDATLGLVGEFWNDNPTVAIIKHNNACGLATRSTLEEAWDKALQGDPISAFGGVIGINKTVDLATAEKINTLFCEVLMAPGYDAEALKLLKSKKNRIILEIKSLPVQKNTVRSVLNGTLVQDADLVSESVEQFKKVTDVTSTSEQDLDLVFANKIVKHTRSNAIVLARDQQLVASGTGQTSRVDALNQAIAKAKHFNIPVEGAVMASDAFFPFPDCVEIADKAGIKAVIQPGGSIKDQLSIDYCNANGLAMVMTGNRHFKH